MGLRKKKTQEQVFAPEAAPQDAYVSDVEARSRDLLESTEKTAREMADFYPTMLHPEDPEAMDRKVRGELDSLRRAATNIMRARQQLFGAGNGNLRVAEHDKCADVEIVRHLAKRQLAFDARDGHRICHAYLSSHLILSHLIIISAGKRKVNCFPP